MVAVTQTLHRDKKQLVNGLDREREIWRGHWRDLADYYLPRRYRWLLDAKDSIKQRMRNPLIIDGTGTRAARILASGMMNGITSPSRPWFKLRIPGFEADQHEVRVWLDEVQRRMLLVMAESNFYTSMAMLYLDLVVFGTSAMLIYEDFDDVINCYNPAIGEYFLGHSSRQKVDLFAREFTYTVKQIVEEFGIENVSENVRNAYKLGAARLIDEKHIVHLLEPNDPRDGQLSERFTIREYYWEKDAPQGVMLAIRGYVSLPGVFPRWETTSNDAYGGSPGMDALGDTIQLQHETKKKAQGLDKMISPPILADAKLEHKPMALLPNGVTYIAGLAQGNVGAKPIHTITLPLGEMTADIRDVQARTRETFHNDLFSMISQLETVRSATEIDARREEKLILLGPVLERFEHEALDPAINRIFTIMERAGLIPEPPAAIADRSVEIQYVSVLASAQSAIGTAAVERWLQLIGELAAGIYPNAVNVPDFEELLRDYGTDIGVPAKHIKSKAEIAEANAQTDELAQQREAAATGDVLVNAGKTLSETDVGGGANALQQILAQT